MAAALLAAGLAVAPALAQGDYVGTFENWEVRVYGADSAEAPRRCAARAFHPAITEGEVFWVVNTGRLDARPLGYLAVDPRLMLDMAAARVSVDGGPERSLTVGPDGWGYNRQGAAAPLFEAMREGVEMTLVLEPESGEGRRLTVSLLGFTRASRVGREACGLPADPS